ncbi:hypothetical protein EDD17DRAFT_1559409 [Pisolithus thermaeus]|nr:hypothetical protein EV401DRAFT_146734 [Pisolithus croceorrhizus]KAI6165038.1 hypothetical protein EDD17DRAFT_1559409 [Pisolithus thermaeus]
MWKLLTYIVTVVGSSTLDTHAIMDGDDVRTPQTIPWISHAFLSLILPSLAFVVIWHVFQWIRTSTTTRPTTARSGIKGKSPSDSPVDASPCSALNANKTRELGVWTPQKINYPEILPCPRAIMEVQPISYRPFRWGEYQ